MMAGRRKGCGKRILSTGGALFTIVFALSLLFCALEPHPSLAAAPDEPVMFTVQIYIGEAREGDQAPFFGVAFAIEGTKISVYKRGRAYAEYVSTDPDLEVSYVFDGRYDTTKKTLYGDIEYHDSKSDHGGTTESFEGSLDGVFSDDDNMAGTVTGTAVWVDLGGDVEVNPGLTDEATTSTIEVDISVSGKVEGRVDQGETGGGGSATPETGSKIPGPGSWWQWLTGTVVAGIIASLISLLNLLFGAAPPSPPPPPPPPSSPPHAPAHSPRKPYVPPPDAPRMGPATPYRETPQGPLVDPQHPPLDLTGLGPAEPNRGDPDSTLILSPGPPGDPGIPDYAGATLDTVKDTAGTLLQGTADFLIGTAKTIGTGYVELFDVGRELANDPIGLVGDAVSPSVLLDTTVNIGGEVVESVNPAQELAALQDPNMSLEGQFWAISSMATKAANVLLLWESFKGPGKAGGLADDAVAPRVPEANVTVGVNETTLWNGPKGQAAAQASGGRTVGMTPGGQAAANSVAGMAWDAARKVWVRLSADYASQAKGVVNCYLENGFKPGTVFSETELGILLKNPNVTKINVFVQEGGQWIAKDLFKSRL